MHLMLESANVYWSWPLSLCQCEPSGRRSPQTWFCPIRVGMSFVSITSLSAIQKQHNGLSASEKKRAFPSPYKLPSRDMRRVGRQCLLSDCGKPPLPPIDVVCRRALNDGTYQRQPQARKPFKGCWSVLSACNFKCVLSELLFLPQPVFLVILMLPAGRHSDFWI